MLCDEFGQKRNEKYRECVHLAGVIWQFDRAEIWSRSQNLTVADPDLQIRGGRGGPAHSDPEIGGVVGGGGGRGLSQFGQFGLQMKGGGGRRAGSFPPCPESATSQERPFSSSVLSKVLPVICAVTLITQLFCSLFRRRT